MQAFTLRFLTFIFLLGFSGLTSLRGQGNEPAGRNEVYLQFKSPVFEASSLSGNNAFLDFMKSLPDAIKPNHSLATFWFSSNSELKRTYRLYYPSEEATQKAINYFNNKEQVKYAEQVPNLRRFFTPNDLGPNNTSMGGQWYNYKIKAQQAWDIQTGSTEIRVAVVDDAIQTNHPDLNGVCYPGYDAAQMDFDVQPPTAQHDHGTHVSGLIAAITDNGLGMASLAHGVYILPVKATLDSNPDNVAGGFEGVSWATENQADVINCSWGAELYSQTGLTVVNTALSANIVVVAAAGNNNNMIVQFPAGYDGVISVASTNSSDTRSTFSSYGPWIDVCAPGSQIWSLSPYDSYARKDGTSFAAPLVSALAALMKSLNPLLTPAEIESCIENSADPIDMFNPGFEGLLGAGRINAQQALLCLQASTIPFNLSLMSIQNIQTQSCENSLNPLLVIRNTGTDTVFNFKVKVQLDAELPEIYTFNDTLLPGEDFTFNLNTLQAAPGNHEITASLYGPINTSSNDGYTPDNQIVFGFEVLNPLGIPLPFFEDFEAGNFFQNNWQLINQSGDFTWEIVPSSSPSGGIRSARLPYYIDFNSGSRDYLVSQTFDFSGYSSISLSFDHAYQQKFPGLSDSLILSISTDCGLNWNRIYSWYENGTNQFATTAPTGNLFLPANPGEWCGASNFAECSEFNLSDYVGNTGVIIRFEGFSLNGNNIYIDNINLTGIETANPVIAQFTAEWDLPACASQEVHFWNTSIGRPDSLVWSFPGGSPSESTMLNPTVVYNEPGSYSVQLIVSNNWGSDTLLINDYVQVNQLPLTIISTDSDTICNGNTSILVASGADYYLWNNGQAMSALDGAQITVAPITSANYIVNGVSSFGCADTALQRITVVSQPSPPPISQSGENLITSAGVSYEWYFNGTLIVGANSQTYTPIENGNYNVRVYIQAGCSSLSGIYPVNWVGVEQLDSNTPSSIFPNPTRDKLFIRTPFNTESLKISDLSGRTISHNEIPPSNQFEWEANHLAPGVYFMTLFGDNPTVQPQVIRFQVIK